MGSARLDAELLLAHALGIERRELRQRPLEPVPDAARAAYEALLLLRIERRPVSQLVGLREFWSLDFEVTPDVLTPRPETEDLVEHAARALRARPDPRAPARVADIGTGSGCIAVSIAVECAEIDDLVVHAVDVSGPALAVAARNVARHGVSERVHLHRGRYLEPLVGHVRRASLDVVVSNPPYVARSRASLVDPEVHWEPAVAVFTEGDPAEVYRAVAEGALPLLAPHGVLLLELPGPGGEGSIAAVTAVVGGRAVEVLDDLAGWPRVLRVGG